MTNPDRFHELTETITGAAILGPDDILCLQMPLAEDNAHAVRDWIANGGGEARVITPLNITRPGGARVTQLVIETLEGKMRADVGDWIIRGVQGEHYPCKSEIFAATYEPVETPA